MRAEERREVARRLRECRGGWSSGECYYTIIHALGLPDTSREDGAHALYAALADLIDPEPERTCKRVKVYNFGFPRSARYMGCSICKNPLDVLDLHCKNCGARVVYE